MLPDRIAGLAGKHGRTALAAALVVSGAPAHPQESIYVGIGAASFDYEENLVDAFFGRVSDSVPAYALFGGFEINDHFALEISYRETDDIVGTGRVNIPPFGNIDGRLTLDTTMTSLMALGQLPLEWGVLLGGLGYFSAENDFLEVLRAECCDDPLINGGSLSDNGLAAKLAVEWRFGRFGTRYGIRLEYDWWDSDDADTSSIGVAFSYGF